MNFEMEEAVKWIAALLAIGAIFMVTFGYIIPNFTKQVQAHDNFFCKIFKNIIKSCTIPGELKELNRQLKNCKDRQLTDCPEVYKALTLIKDKQVKITNDCKEGLTDVNCKTKTSEITLLNGKEELGKLSQDFLFRTCENEKDPSQSSFMCSICDYYYTLSQKDLKPQVHFDYSILKGPYPIRKIGANGDYLCIYYED